MLDTLTDQQYEAVKKAICPYCDGGLRDLLAVGNCFLHFIPDDPKDQRWICLAERFRRKRYEAIQNKEHATKDRDNE